MHPLLLDLDGTLVDSRTDLATATNLLLVELGLPRLPVDVIAACVGRGARALVRRALDRADPERRIARDDPRLRRFLPLYETVMLQSTAPFPGVRAGLDALVAAGVPLAVVTNKPIAPARRLLLSLGLDACFPVVLGGDSLPTKKPDPAMLIAAARGLSVDLADCLMVGDSDVDIDAARAAGIPGVWCSWGGFHADRPATAQVQVDRFDEIVALAI